MEDLLPEFVAETRETLQEVAGALVEWEGDPGNRELLDRIFRFVHTVKGSCGFLDLPRLERLSHAAEDALAEVRAGGRRADAGLVSAVLAVVDRIGELAEAIETGEAISDADEPRLVAALAADAEAGVSEAPAAQPAIRGPGQRPPARTVRLPVDLLDRMMGSVSDMVLARNELARELGGAAADALAGHGSAFERLSLCVRELKDAVQRARMSRIDTLFAAIPRLVRDLAGELGKAARAEVDGGEVELDREMIEMIRDPLTHMIRNAVDHGLEPRAARLAAGKPAEGRLRVAARQSANRIHIVVEDDGAGIDLARVVARAVENGLVPSERAPLLTEAERLELIFAPGLSTARTVTELSGRGVGMDIVRANVERLGGTVRAETTPGRSTRLLLEVPLTLSIIPALVVGVGADTFALARASIDEIVRVGGPVLLHRVGGGLIAEVRGRRLPVVALGDVLGLPGGAARFLVLVHGAGGGRCALLVDAVHDHQELVIKPAAPAVTASGLFAGVTLPDNSRPLLLLDVNGIAAAAGVRPAIDEAVAAPAPAAPTLPTLLFRDLDGTERAVRLAAVERIEEVPRAALVRSGGGWLAAHGGLLRRLVVLGPVPDAAGRLPVLRLRAADGEAALLVARVLDVVDAPFAVAPVAAGPVAGLFLHEDRPVELVDPDRLAVPPAAAAPPSFPRAEAA